jgi:short-subunit dehydrogenase
MRIAIVTGASSGLGKVFASQLAQQEKLDEIWAIARREDRLRALGESLSVPVRALPLDLRLRESMETLSSLLETEKPEVSWLINASGFGKFGTYRDVTIEETHDMIDVDVKAAVDVGLTVLPYMKAGGRILNICSVAAFQPLPGFGVYAACKSFLLSYTRSLHAELRERSITATAVCPNWIRTEFIKVAKETEAPGAVEHFYFMAEAPDVVQKALRDSRRGKDISVYGVASKAQHVLCRLLPHRLVMALWNRIRH